MTLASNKITGSISVFFPAYNDEASIPALVQHALEILPTVCDDYEVIIVNDGSTDGTAAVLEQLVSTNAHVRVVLHEENRGYGAALRSGIKAASKEFIFYTDGDGQYDVRELRLLLASMTPAVDVVNGYKINRADTKYRRLLGGLYNRAARLLFRLPIRDVDCDFRLMRRSAVQSLSLQSNGGAICVELISKLQTAGSAFAEVPVHHYPRHHGRSQFFRPKALAITLREFVHLLATSRSSDKRNRIDDRDTVISRADNKHAASPS
jgi:glycosyltransferase involved in cell wall biosynthesis